MIDRDVSGFVRLFLILMKNKIFRICSKIFIILRPKYHIFLKFLVNLKLKIYFYQN